MTNEERVKLVFETISKIAGFEIKPNKEFYMIVNGEKVVYLIDKSLNLFYKKPDGYFGLSNYNTKVLFNGRYQLEEIKEPLLTEEGKEFLRNFNFEELEILTHLHLYDKDGLVLAIICLNAINYSFDRLERDKKYTSEELGL